MIFTIETTRLLEIKVRMWAMFYADDDKFYLALLNVEDGDAFPIKRMGRYFYMQTYRLLTALGYDYSTGGLAFRLVRKNELDNETKGRTYQLEKIETARKQKSPLSRARTFQCK